MNAQCCAFGAGDSDGARRRHGPFAKANGGWFAARIVASRGLITFGGQTVKGSVSFWKKAEKEWPKESAHAVSQCVCVLNY